MSMEGEGRFEKKPGPRKGGEPTIKSRTETPQQRFRNELRRDITDIQNSTRDVLAYEVGLKILEKLDIKDRIDEIQKYRDNPSVYQHWKQLGLFIVIDYTSRIDWKDEKSGFGIKKGDKILDIHLPPVPEGQNNLSTVTQSMQLVAEYIARQNLDVKYLVGVTFEKLARVSRRQGFTVVEPQLPEDIKRGVENVYRRFGNRGINEKQMGRVLLCYQPTSQFLQRYLIKK